MIIKRVQNAALICLIAITPCLAGTTGKITGQVTDQQGNPLPGAFVRLEGAKRGIETDAEGIYFLLSIAPGNHTLRASMIGYENQEKTDVRISSDLTTNASFVLKEMPLENTEIVVEAQTGNAGWSMLSAKANLPAVEPDKTTSQYVVRANDIETLSIVRNVAELIGLQAGVTVDAQGDEISIRAGDTEDIGYYFDGVLIPSTDHIQTRVYRDFNRLAIQEMTVVTGGMNAEYGNAQGGIISVVTKEGGAMYQTLIDYQFTPAGQKHWGQNVYDSPIHREHAQWHDSAWVSETVTLPNGQSVPAHQRVDYTHHSGHFLEGNLSGPLSNRLSFFTASRWQKKAAAFPGPYLTTPFNLNTTTKLTYTATPNLKVTAGGLYDRRKGANTGPETGGQLNLQNQGRNLFLTNPSPTGSHWDTDKLIYIAITHLLSPRTFYEIRLSHTSSHRDTTHIPLPDGLTHISEATSGMPIYDRDNIYTVYREAIGWERWHRNRLIFKADLSSQINKQHFLKTGFEGIHYNTWYQSYRSEDALSRMVKWFGKTYQDTDFFPDQKNRGVTPTQMGIYAQDKIEMDGLILNAGLRFDAFDQNTYVTDVVYLGDTSPMWNSMTKVRNAPTVKAPTRKSLNHRLGISHPVTGQSILRFFYGKVTQFPSFNHLFVNTYASLNSQTDSDLNQNGQIDPAERWNTFTGALHQQHNPYLQPEETTSFEVGLDWNIVSDYVLSLTTYYKSANNQIDFSLQTWLDPVIPGAPPTAAYASGIFRDTRGLEFSLKKRFSHMFAFNFGLNLQWADELRSMGQDWRTRPDSLFIANGHYYLMHDIDPATGEEIPVSLKEMAIREGKDPDHYIKLYGARANQFIRDQWIEMETVRSWSWVPWASHYASEGVPLPPEQIERVFYSDQDQQYWARINATPNYPGTGEGNLMVRYAQKMTERASASRDRRAFGSLTFLFATPPGFGNVLGNLQANLVYRFFTGTPFVFTPVMQDLTTGRLIGTKPVRNYGPMHTRTDVHIEKTWGQPTSLNLTFALEIFNLFNQKDVRSVPPGTGRNIDFDPNRWQFWGIQGLEPTSPDVITYGEINDINNYWDQPRELTFGLRIKW